MSGEYQTIGGYGIDLNGINPASGDPINLGALVDIRGDNTDTTTNFDALDRTGNGHTFRQATAADKPTIVTVVEANNQLGFRLDGVSDFLASINTAAFWQFISNGNGFTNYSVVVPRALPAGGAQLHSNYTVGAQTGIQIGCQTASLVFNVFENIGAFSVTMNESTVFTIGQCTSIVTSYTEGAAPNEWGGWIGNHLLQQGNSALAPGTNTPAATMNLGRRANGTGFWQVDVLQSSWWNRALTNEEKVKLAIYTLNRYKST